MLTRFENDLLWEIFPPVITMYEGCSFCIDNYITIIIENVFIIFQSIHRDRQYSFAFAKSILEPLFHSKGDISKTCTLNVFSASFGDENRRSRKIRFILMSKDVSISR